MELDDMKLAWQAIGRQMERRYALDFEVFREGRLRKARRQLLPLRIGLALRLAFGIVLMGLAARFWVMHWGAVHLVVCGLLVHAYGLLLAVTAGHESDLLRGVDYADPVLALQRKLERLRRWRMRTVPLWIFTGCLVWVPMLLIAFRWLGVDVWRRSPSVVGWFVLSGLVALAGFYAVWRWWPGAAGAMRRDAVGCSLDRSKQFLDEISRFEGGDTTP
jgi:hypothetical protein